MSLHPVDSAIAHVALHWSARSRGYKLSRERERVDPKSLVVYEFVLLVSEVYSRIGVCFSSESPPRCGPCLPFYSPKGRARVTFVVKR
jgi:hypothetical protein